jgi:lysophospholipase L1-like esterase
MRTLFLFHVYSGDMLFTAAGLLVVSVVADFTIPPRRHEIARRAARILFLLSVPLGALATVPLSRFVVIPLGAAWIAHMICGFGNRSRRAAFISGSLVLVLGLAALVPELAWRVKTSPRTPPPPKIFVMGDSLSSGGFGEDRTWVERLRSRMEIELVDLSSPSETTASAIQFQIPELSECERCGVLIELGGNEMLGGGSVEEYERNLRALIRESRERNAEVVWLLEFPPLPARWAWAAAQRRTARATGSILIPRRILAGVLVKEENTFDGLHLTDRGHAELAARVEPWLGGRTTGLE